MTRILLIVTTLIAMAQGPVMAQGILDSVFGPSGLGLWDSGSTNQGGGPQYFDGSPPPAQQPQFQQQYYQQSPQDYASGGYQAPQQYQAPPQQYQTQQQPQSPEGYGSPYGYGTYQPGTQYQWESDQPPAAAAAPPPARYAAPPMQPGRRLPPQRGSAGTQLRPGQYVPNRAPGSEDDLPAGSVRITTTTPEGTTVQFYPPSEPEYGQAPSTAPRRRPAVRRPAAARTQAARSARGSRTAPAGQARTGPAIAMPKPVQIPRGHDPRSGWESAVNRGPTR